jgi:Secretion system C-terminal sorting domain
MKKTTKNLLTIFAVFIFLSAVTIEAQVAVDQWGLSDYKFWPILNDNATPAGNASIAGEGVNNWKSLQGGFAVMNIATDKAVVVKGQIEFAGAVDAEDAYTPLRYAFTFQDSSTLANANTDSASWSHSGNHFGYSFHPRTGTGTMSNGGGGAGTAWTINNGNWASTWSNNGRPMAAINQAPRNAQIVAGKYDFAISVVSIDDTSNEISWYMIEENNGYWFGGKIIDTATTKKFNNVIFGINDVAFTSFNVSGMTVELGDPIVVPEAPWESYYVDQWGLADYKFWPILNDTNTIVGDASIAGEGVDNWKSVQGGFGQDVSITTEKAIILEGQIEFAGAVDAEDAYTPLRYALTYQDSNSTLQNANTDSASWSHSGNHFGYGFHPRTGTGTMSNGGGGAGTAWTINNGNWASTWSNNGRPMAAIDQAPRNAQIVEGTYNFAISVRSIDDITNEIKWYMVEKDNKYWFGGTVIDTSTTKKFNSIIFGINDVAFTEFNVIAMKVDKGDPIVVPEAPWESYYVDQWGLADYKFWPILNDTNTIVGDASIAGEGVDNWKSVQGGFGQDVTITTEKAIIVEGQIEFAGVDDAGDAYTPLRYALTYQDSNATLENALTDSASWSRTGNHFGYGFHPRTGTGTMSNGGGGAGTAWTINNGNWASTWSNNGRPMAAIDQAPRNAPIVAGTYDFAISVRSIDDITNEIKWYMVEKDNKYWFGGTVIDTSTTKKFNSIIFGINDVAFTEFNVIAMEVDKGDPIVVPEAPWEDFYVGKWGFLGGRSGAWEMTPGEFTGNVSVSGDAPAGNWVAVRGDFEGNVTSTTEMALQVEGEMELVGGGFEDWSSLRLGLFNSSSAGDLDTNNNWTGDEISDGYLVLPHSGTNDVPTWNGTPGTFGAIVNASWISTNSANNIVLKDKLQSPAGAVAGADTYMFKIWVIQVDGQYDIRYQVKNNDDSYVFEGGKIDANMTATSFNSINIGLNSTTATAMNLADIQVLRVDPELIEVDVSESASNIPVAYALAQNYPNPFNPTTTIEFALPQSGHVKIVVYDALGRIVSELVNSELNAGNYKTNFNAANFASGIYFYKIQAGDFVDVKKLMLLK